MPDTTYYDSDDLQSLYDSIAASQKQLIEQYEDEAVYNKKEGEGYAAVFWLFIIVVAFIAVRRAWKEKGTTILYGSNDKRRNITIGSEKLSDVLHEYHIYEGKDLAFTTAQYHAILNKRSTYYKRLDPSLKDIFLERVKRFIASKTFLVKGDEVFIEMPVLISATAVQLTFGLKKYRLPHYRYIRIFPAEYLASGTLKFLAGHVYGNTITLAWNHFLTGHEEYTDGINVGLHEMAHALYFQLVEAGTGRCEDFASNFNQVLQQGEHLYQLKETRPSGLFTPNAYRNLQEFWAESVEIFFERPSELRRENEKLYYALTAILNQDPANKMSPVASYS